MNTPWSQPGPRHQATLQLLRTAEILWRGSHRLFARWNLSPSQFNVLNLLLDYPQGCSQVDLSRALIMNRSNVTGLVDRLEIRGLLQRQETPGDRRAYRVVLTQPGRQLVQEMLPAYYQGAEEIWNHLPLKRVQQLTEDLQRVCAHADQVIAQLEAMEKPSKRKADYDEVQ